MTNPLLYDVKRSLTSKSVLIMMVVLILFSFALVPSFTATSTGPGSNNYAYTQAYAYYDSSGYHFLAFAWNRIRAGGEWSHLSSKFEYDFVFITISS